MSSEKTVTIPLIGRIDSNNAAEAEQTIRDMLPDAAVPVVLDASKLEYIPAPGCGCCCG